MLLAVALPAASPAATWYVDGAAPNDSGAGDAAHPKKYIPSGIALMSSAGGDTLIVRAGTYSGSANAITALKSGRASAFNVIKAEFDGAVAITASLAARAGSYVQLEGLKLAAPETKYAAGDHVRFLRCAFEGGSICSQSCDGEVVVAAGSYQLFEDCWFFGVGGRYTVLVYEVHDTVFRRCVARRDGGYTFDGSNPEAVWSNYGSYNISYQNCLSIDNTLAYSSGYSGSFYCTGHGSNPASNNVSFLGCMDLNGQSGSYYTDTDDGSTGMTLRDFVAYDNESGINDGNTGTALTLERVTLGKMSGSAINVWSGSVNLTDGLVFDHTEAGAGVPTAQHTDAFHPDSYSGTGVIHVDPRTNGLRHLPRIESGTTLAVAGKGGGQVGASLLERVGADGTFFGEPGFDAPTSKALWPWPNEGRIKADFAAVAGGARGFAAAGKQLNGTDDVTLTSYVWEYLGNPMPCEIYGRCTGPSDGGVPGADAASASPDASAPLVDADASLVPADAAISGTDAAGAPGKDAQAGDFDAGSWTVKTGCGCASTWDGASRWLGLALLLALLASAHRRRGRKSTR